MVTTGQGEVALAIDSHAAAGTVDFHLQPAPGVGATAFSRVVPNGDGAEFLFTQLQQPGVPDEVRPARLGGPPRAGRPQGVGGGGVPAPGPDQLRRLAFAAGEGDSAALERIVAAVQDDVFRLALRMLWDRRTLATLRRRRSSAS